jgi:hypothetical protein
MRRMIPAVLVAALAALGGCGGDENDSRPSGANDRQAVQRQVASYLKAYAAGDGERACRHLTPSRRRLADAQTRQRGTGSCERVLSIVGPKLLNAVPAGQRQRFLDMLTDPSRVSAKITGDRAVASLQGATQRLELRRVDGRWLIDKLGLPASLQ